MYGLYKNNLDQIPEENYVLKISLQTFKILQKKILGRHYAFADKFTTIGRHIGTSLKYSVQIALTTATLSWRYLLRTVFTRGDRVKFASAKSGHFGGWESVATSRC